LTDAQVQADHLRAAIAELSTPEAPLLLRMPAEATHAGGGRRLLAEPHSKRLCPAATPVSALRSSRACPDPVTESPSNTVMTVSGLQV